MRLAVSFILKVTVLSAQLFAWPAAEQHMADRVKTILYTAVCTV